MTLCFVNALVSGHKKKHVQSCIIFYERHREEYLSGNYDIQTRIEGERFYVDTTASTTPTRMLYISSISVLMIVKTFVFFNNLK